MQLPGITPPRPSWRGLRSLGQGLLAAGEFPDQAAIALMFGPESAAADSPAAFIDTLNPMMAMGGGLGKSRLNRNDPVVEFMRNHGRYDLSPVQPHISGVPVPREFTWQRTAQQVPFERLQFPPALKDVLEPGQTTLRRHQRLFGQRLQQQTQHPRYRGDDEALDNWMNDVMRPGGIRVRGRTDAAHLRRKERSEREHYQHFWRLKREDLRKDDWVGWARQRNTENRLYQPGGVRAKGAPGGRPELNAISPAAAIGYQPGGARKRVTKRTGVPDATIAFHHRDR